MNNVMQKIKYIMLGIIVTLSFFGVSVHASERITLDLSSTASESYVINTPGDYECEIVETGVRYKTLKAAVADANSLSGANTIRLLADIDFKTDTNAVLTVSEDLTIIGEHTISRGGYTENLFKIPVGIKLTLDDGVVFDGSNDWELDEELFEYNLVNRIQASSVNDYITPQEGGTVATAAMFNVLGTLEMNDVVMQNNYTTKSNSGIVYLSGADAILITNGTEFKDCASTGSSTIVSLNKNSKWYINDGTNIHDSFVGGNGGICYISSSNVYMSGGIITHTRGYNSNGTVFMMYSGNATLNMTGGTICENYGTIGPQNGRNAAVYLHSTGILNMTGGSICHNIGNRRGGIDSYKSNSTLNINRVDQEFIDGKPVNENGVAAYNADNHPYIGDNVSLIGESQYDVGYNVDQTAHWWVTGGIYTQDVDEFCAEGYVCIPYDITARTDDYIVVPGYRVRYFSVEKDITTDTDGNEITDYKKTLEDKYIHMLPKDKFWYEMDEHAEYIEVINEKHENIDTWYTEQELVNMYDFENTKLTDNLDLYGEYENHVHTEVKIEAVINGDASHTKKFNYKSEYTDVYNYFDENGNSTNYNFTLDINTSTKIELVALGSELIITETKPAEYTLDIDVTYLDENGNRVSSDYTLIDNGVKVKVNKGLEIKFIHKKAEMTTNKFVTGSSTDDLVINLETYVNGDTLAVEQTRPADVVLVIDQSGSMIRPIVDKEKLTRTDLATDQAKENGTHGLYYLAYGSSTVNYLVFKDGEWYRYETNRSKTSGWDDCIPNMDVIRNNLVLMDDAKWTEFEQYGIWQTRYGATYDALKAFINTLKDEGIDHRVAFVGFGSASDGITNLIVDGVKTKYNSLTNDICADAFRSILTDTDSLMSSLEAIHCNSKYTNAGAGLSIARKIYDNNSADSSRDRMVILFSDGADAKGTDPYGNSYALKNTYGAKIYSIKAASATATFLDHMSSNYPEATSASAVGTKYSDKYFLTTGNADDLIAVFSSLVSEVLSSGTKLNTYTVIRDTMSEYFELPAGINASNVKEYIKVYTADYMADGTFSNNLVDITNDDNIIITLKTHNGKDVVEVTGFDFADNYIAITNGTARGKKLIIKIPIVTNGQNITGSELTTNDPDNSGIYNDDVCIKPFETPKVDLPATVSIVKSTNGPIIDKEYVIELQYDKHRYVANGNYLQSEAIVESGETNLKHGQSFELPKIVLGGEVKISSTDLDSVKLYKYVDGVKEEITDYTLSNDTVKFTVTSDMEIEIIDNIYTYAYIDGVNGKDSNDGLTADSSVKTLKQAYINLPAGGTIYVVDTITIGTSLQELTITKNSYKDTNTEIIYNNDVNISIKRYSQPTVMTDNNDTNNIEGFSATSNINSMIVVSAGSKLKVGDIILDGHKNDVTSGPIHLIAKGVTSDAKSSIIKIYGDLVLDGGTIQNNKISNVIDTAKTPYGAGLAVYGNGTITMESGWIINNESVDHPKYAKLWSSGAGVYVHGESTFIMNGGVISGNIADDNGAGVRNGHEFIMNGGIICNNIAKNDGGGVYSKETEDKQFIMNGGAIYGNTAGNLGGGIYIEVDDTVINTGEIYDNKASNGGGVYVKKGTFTSNNANIYQNEATNGGGIYIADKAILTGETNIYDNKASKGGGIYQDGKLYLEENVVVNTNNDIYLPNNRFVYAKDLVGNDIVARLTPNTYTNGRTVVRLIPNENYEVASDLISRFELTPSGNKALRPGDYIVESKNILDTDIIISELFNITYDKGTTQEVTNLPTVEQIYWCEPAYVSDLIPERLYYEFLGWSKGSTEEVNIMAGDLLEVTDNITIYAVWDVVLGLDAKIIRILGNKEPIFRAGELGCIIIDTEGSIKDIEIIFPDNLDDKLSKLLNVNLDISATTESRFIVPLGITPGTYVVKIIAYSPTGETISVNREFIVIDGSILNDIKTIIK